MAGAIRTAFALKSIKSSFFFFYFAAADTGMLVSLKDGRKIPWVSYRAQFTNFKKKPTGMFQVAGRY